MKVSKFDFDKIKQDVPKVKEEKPAYKKSDNYRIEPVGEIFKKIKKVIKKK